MENTGGPNAITILRFSAKFCRVSDDKVLKTSDSIEFANKNKYMGKLSVNYRMLWR
jgi:hypothetical protein